MINIPLAPLEYDQRFQTDLNEAVNELDENTLKLDQDNFIVTGSIVLQSPDGTLYKLQVANGGALSATAVTTEQTSNPYV